VFSKSDELRLQGNGKPGGNADKDFKINADELEKNLAKLARLALLVA
jgi:hypothetical protein